MRIEEYMLVQSQLQMLGQMALNTEQLDEFLSQINRTESVGPLVDPTLWIKAGSTLGRLKRIGEAAREFRRVCVEVDAEHKAEVARKVSA